MATVGLGTRRRARPARHVVGVTAAAHENLARAGLQIQNGHLCSIEAACERRDREQHGAATGQQFRPQVIEFPLRTVGSRQDRRRPARGRDPL